MWSVTSPTALGIFLATFGLTFVKYSLHFSDIIFLSVIVLLSIIISLTAYYYNQNCIYFLIFDRFLGKMQRIAFRLMLSSCVCACLCVRRVCGKRFEIFVVFLNCAIRV